MKLMKRFLCLLLALVMVLGYIPGAVETAAAQEDGLCEVHHPEHTEDCGYVPAVQGKPCTHDGLCDNDCLTVPVEECIFPHENCECRPEVQEQDCNGSCELARQKAAVRCSCPVNEDGTVTHDPETCDYQEKLAAVETTFGHNEACGYAAYQPPVTCGHVCTMEYGCIVMTCSHAHSEECGYSERTEGEPCKFAGKPCAQCEAEKTPSLLDSSTTLPMYARVGGSDGVSYFESFSEPGNSTGPWLSFVKEKYESSEALVGFTTSDSEIVELVYPENNINASSLCLRYKNAGTATITHTAADGTVYSFTVTVTQPEEPVLRYRVGDNGPCIGGTWKMYAGSSTMVKFYIGTNRFTQIDMENERHSLDVTTENNDGVITLEATFENSGWYSVKAEKTGTATIVYNDTAANKKYTLNVVVEEPNFWMIPVQPYGNANWIDLSSVAEPVDLRCYLAEMYGPPVMGPLPDVYSSDETVFTLTVKDEASGIYTLTPVGSGKAQLVCEVNGTTYTSDVAVMDKNFKADGLVYYPAVHGMSGKTYPKTVASIGVGEQNGIAQEFYYSEPAEAMLLAEGDMELEPLTRKDVTCSGPITVSQPEGDTKLHIIGTDVGTGYLEVTSEDGITHCFVVNVGRSAPNEEVQEGGYMWLDEDTVIGFGNPGIASEGDNNAEAGVLKLRSQINNGFDSSYPEDHQYREPMCFAAMDETNGKPAASVMAAVRNVQFSVLACRNTDNTPVPYPSVELENCEQIELAEDGVSAWTNYLVAGGKKAFSGLVGMTFDLPAEKDGESITRRISLYVLTHNTYMGEDVTVLANIESAAQLNVILSSYEALKTWIKAEYPEYRDVVDGACNVNIKLPSGDFTDTVVVSETIAPFPFKPNPTSNPNFRIYIRAPRQEGKTTLAGLVSRGCLAGIFDVNFEATEGANMTYGNETFTCGLMADSEWSGEVKYDMDFAEKYGIDPTQNKRNLSSWQNDHGMKEIDCDIMSVEGCSFTGFDYGTRSTENGYVGGGVGNSFDKCYYGIYIDCPQKPAGFNITYTGFGGYDFKKNVVAVRIVALQEGMTPYAFRIHDCDFINNYLEFWIDAYDTTFTQQYYFYRNHYRGGWKLGGGNGNGNSSGYGWVKHEGKAPDDEKLPDVHRGPKYRIQDSNGSALGNGEGTVTISGTPGSSAANLSANAVSRSSSEGYWIYDGEDQVTLIEKGGDILPLAQESLESLTQDADVSVVTNQGADTVAVWTFEGGE